MAELAFSRPTRLYAVRATDVLLAVLWTAGMGIAVIRGGGVAGQLVLSLEVSSLVAIAWWDSRTLRAPNAAVLPALAATLAASLLFGAEAALSAAAGAALGLGTMLLLAFAGGGRLGGGDVKFGALCGAVLGLGGVLTGMAAACIAGGAIAAVVLGLRLRKRADVMAFTPLLAAGALFALAVHGAYQQL